MYVYIYVHVTKTKGKASKRREGKTTRGTKKAAKVKERGMNPRKGAATEAATINGNAK